MACFIVPTTEAIVTTVITKVMESKEKKAALADSSDLKKVDTIEVEKKIKGFSHKMKWLNTMLWGGSALLAFEHIWHGEVTPWFPFLTAANDPAELAEMFTEMSTVGVTMAVLVTLVWGIMVTVSSKLEKSDASVMAKKEK